MTPIDDPGEQRPRDAGEAINRVLQAERDAALAIEQCQQQAQELRQQALRRAQHIAERTDRRITRIQMRCAQAVRERIRALERIEETAASGPAPGQPGEALIAELIEALAAELTGVTRPAADETGS